MKRVPDTMPDAAVGSRRWRELVLLVVALVASLTIAELITRFAVPSARNDFRYLLHPPNRLTEFRPAAGVMPGVNNAANRFSTNSMGMRGAEPPHGGAVRILVLGGSTAEVLFLDDADAWPRVLQDGLNERLARSVWVGNAGRSGLNSFSHLTQLHVYVPYLRPQLVVVLAGINDLNQCISGGRQVVEQNAAGIDKPGFHDEYASVVFTEVLEPRPWWYPRLVDLVRQPLTRLQRRTPEDVGDYVVQDQAGGFYLAQRARRMAAEKVDVVPDVATCLDAFEANLERMVDRARRQGFDLLLLTQGALYRDDLTADEQALLWFGSVDENPFAAKAPERYFTVRAMSRMLHAYNERTRKVCAQRDIACVDVARELPPTTETYYDDVHFNPQGSRRLGDLLIPVVAGLIEGR